MHYLNRELLSRRSFLRKIVRKVNKELTKSPDGRLKITKSHGTNQFRIITNLKDSRGIYIPKAEINKAKAIAQRDYYREVLEDAQTELNCVEALIRTRRAAMLEKRYITLTDARQALVKPITLTNEEYAERWQNEPYQPGEFKPDDPVFYSMKGERMRSKSEVLIADTLYKLGIPYRYEYPIKLENGKIIRPDFMILNPVTREVYIWEHLGKCDDQEYMEYNTGRIDELTLNGYIPGKNLILTFETRKKPLSSDVIIAVIEANCS